MLVGLKEVIEEGKARGIAVGNFNTPNLECLIAVLDAAEELDVPVIIAHAQCHESIAPLDKIGPVMVELISKLLTFVKAPSLEAAAGQAGEQVLARHCL